VPDLAASVSPRAAALAALAVVSAGGKLDVALDRCVRRGFDRRETAFAEELAKAAVRHRRFLDYQLETQTARPLSKAPPAVREILRLGAAEIFLLRTPAYAAVDEAGGLARAAGYAGLVPFVNGVLRQLAARGAPAAPPGPDVERLGVTYSYPDWLVRRWLERFGAAEAEALLAAGNAPAPLTLYANAARTTREALARSLREAGFDAADGPFGALAVELGERRLAELPGYDDGCFAVLDPASTLGPRWLAAGRGATVVDLCAGVGGKAFQLAAMVGPAGKVVAYEIDPRKAKSLRAGGRRFGLANVEVRGADVLQAELLAADFVFLDAPCTNLGVIRHKPDIKWRVREEDVAAAAASERAMLARAAASLRPGGRLLYNVCTVEPEETDDVVAAVLAADASLAPLACRPELNGAGEAGPFLRTWPQRDGCNGGFAALLVRTR